MIHRHKFGAKRVECDGIKFSSIKEKNYYFHLKLRVKTGEVLFFLRQVPIHIGAASKYVVDFQEFHADGTVHFIDVKGMKTPMYKLKKKLVHEQYPIELEEV